MTSFSKNSEDVLSRLIRSFFNNSLNFSLLPKEIEEINWDIQQTFLNCTVNNNNVKKYPMSSEFCRLFFKKLIGYLEQYHEIHDDFYSFLCSVLEKNSSDIFSYRHYIVGDDFHNLITIKETKNMVLNGTTGMKTWQSALMLADWIIQNKNIFQNKKILELGSGVGFTGIAIAKNCKVHSVQFTDCHNDVLKTICDNIEINFPDMQKEGHEIETIFKNQENTLGVTMLDWNCVNDVKEEMVPDIVIGGDIIYDPSILEPLCNTITTFFGRNKNLEVYIANIIRNQETYNSFKEVLGSLNLSCEEISHTKSVFIDWDESIDKCLLRIKQNKFYSNIYF